MGAAPPVAIAHWMHTTARRTPALVPCSVPTRLFGVSPGPEPDPVVGRFLGGSGLVRLDRLRSDSWFDPMVMVAAAHAAFLVGLGEVRRPFAVLAIVVALIGWHLLARAFAPAGSSWLLRDIGSQLAAAGTVLADGGSESPFFFWVLLFLAGQAIRHPVSSFRYLAALALVADLAITATELTVASIGRLALLLAFCLVMAYLRITLDRESAGARQVDSVMWTAFEAAPQAIVLLNDELSVVYANPPANRLLDLIDDSSRVVLDTGEEMALESAFALAERMDAPELVRLTGRLGRRDLRVLSVAVDIAGGRHILVFAEDVTEIVSAGEERTRFLQAAAHQFRTPLTPIRGYSAMLADGEIPEEHIGEAAGAINAGAIRLEQLLDRLAMLLNLRSSTRRPVRQVTVSDLVASAIRDRKGLVRCSGDGALAVSCDPEAAALGISELIDNGALHGRPPVLLESRSADGGVEIRVSDMGEGPPLSDGAALDRAWSTAFPNNVVSARMGTQLGLSQAHSLVELAGGELRFHRSDEGWWFAVGFPTATD